MSLCLYLEIIEGTEKGQTEDQGTEQHVEVVKGEEQADEDSANI